MDRHICRAKDIKTGEWVYGYYIHCDGEINHGRAFILSKVTGIHRYNGAADIHGFIEVDPETVCQCTGVPDKKGKMLFEHDIVKMRSYNRGCHETEVYFKNGKFAVDGSHYSFKDICSNSVEFVRSKFDNPELLEVQNEM